MNNKFNVLEGCNSTGEIISEEYLNKQTNKQKKKKKTGIKKNKPNQNNYIMREEMIYPL